MSARIIRTKKAKGAKGFTLIELLVVISIISLLSSIAFAALSTARERARIAGGLQLASNLVNTFGAESAGIWNLDEGSGSVAHNTGASGGPDGVITSPSWVSGPNGKSALAFSSGANVSLGQVTTNINCTIAAWIQTSSGAQQPAFSNRGSGMYFGMTGGKFFTYYNNSSVAAMLSSKSVNDGKWHHVVWSSDGVTEKMYIDGLLDSSLPQARSAADTSTGYIGYDLPNGEYFSGSIAQVAVYTQTLGDADVGRLYAEQKGRFEGLSYYAFGAEVPSPLLNFFTQKQRI